MDADAVGAAAASLSFWVLALDFLGFDLGLGFSSPLLRPPADFCAEDGATAGTDIDCGSGRVSVGGGEGGKTSAITSSTSLRFVPILAVGECAGGGGDESMTLVPSTEEPPLR